jgi:prepilin-type N-terminal cleavage/methylation domain-containing protein
MKRNKVEQRNLSTNSMQGLPATELSSHVATGGGASAAVRSQAEPWNEVRGFTLIELLVVIAMAC